MNFRKSVALIVGIIALVGIGMFAENMRSRQARAADERELRFFQSIFVEHSMADQQGSYHIVSLDGGQTWVSVTRVDGDTEHKGFAITGPAEREVVKRVLGWKTFFQVMSSPDPVSQLADDPELSKILAGADITLTKR